MSDSVTFVACCKIICSQTVTFFSAAGRGATASVSPQEEEELRALAATPNVYESLARSVAPSIYGSDDLKKAITCLLFGGSRKR